MNQVHVLTNYLVLGAVLFALGSVGFLVRRNLIIMFLSVEMMLQGVALNLVAFGRHHENYQGQSFTIFVLTIAACEAAIAMALFVVLYQRHKTLDVQSWSKLSEEAAGTVHPTESAPAVAAPVELPHLTPAGHEPRLPLRKVAKHV